MTQKYYYLLLLPILAFVIVVGTGFWYVNRSANSGTETTLADGDYEQPYIHPVDTVDPDSDEAKIERLKQAIKKFKNARSFKAEITESREEGKLNSELSYVKPLRLQATVSLDGDKAFEMIVVGETAYARFPEDEWKMTNDETIREFARNFFKSMLDIDDDLKSYGIKEDAEFVIKENPRDDCLSFATLYTFEEASYPITFCIDANNNLVKLVKQDDEGEVTSRYSEHDKFLNIERPVLPLLEPAWEFQLIDESE